jgi:hypothetical protein
VPFAQRKPLVWSPCLGRLASTRGHRFRAKKPASHTNPSLPRLQILHELKGEGNLPTRSVSERLRLDAAMELAQEAKVRHVLRILMSSLWL